MTSNRSENCSQGTGASEEGSITASPSDDEENVDMYSQFRHKISALNERVRKRAKSAATVEDVQWLMFEINRVNQNLNGLHSKVDAIARVVLDGKDPPYEVERKRRRQDEDRAIEALGCLRVHSERPQSR